MEDKIRYKSLDGKRFSISVDLGTDGYAKWVEFKANNVEKRSESLVIYVIANRTTLSNADILANDKRISAFLSKYGLELTIERIEKGILEYQEIVLKKDDLVNIDAQLKKNISSKEEFKSRRRIQQGVLDYLYSNGPATYKELADYVWCKNELLLEELQYLDKRKLILLPQPMSTFMLDVGDNNPANKAMLLATGKHKYEQMMEKDIINKNTELQLFKDWVSFASNKKVFIAHRFDEVDLIKQIKDKLIGDGFIPIEGKVEDLAPITEDILKKIQSSGFFLALITPYKEFKDGTFSTSSWVLMEIGAAIAYGRIVLVLAEDCVERKEYAKKLQPDGQYEIFNREKDFEDKLELAVKRIKNEWDKHK